MDLRELNKTLAATPPQKKKVIFVLVIVISILFGFFYIYQPKQRKMDILNIRAGELKKTLRENLEVTKGIQDIEEELKRINLNLLHAQAQLPTEKEIPSLLAKISDLGSLVGLEFLLFQPQPEVPTEFYNEVPIDIVIKGNYHMVAQFFDLIAHLSRIVNISDINMTNPEFINKNVILKTSCIATTFRFIPKKAKTGENKKKKK